MSPDCGASRAPARPKTPSTTTWSTDWPGAQPRDGRHQGGSALPARARRRARPGCSSCAWAPATRPTPRSARPSMPCSRSASQRPMPSTAGSRPSRCPRTCATCSARPSPGLLWTKQYYHYFVDCWLKGDPTEPPPPASRTQGRNHDWMAPGRSRRALDARQVGVPVVRRLGHGLPLRAFALIDPDFAKQQLTLLTREWYMHPNGQIPAYEWNFGDVNPPVHAWAAMAGLSDRAEDDRAHGPTCSWSASSTSC